MVQNKQLSSKNKNYKLQVVKMTITGMKVSLPINFILICILMQCNIVYILRSEIWCQIHVYFLHFFQIMVNYKHVFIREENKIKIKQKTEL